MTTKKLIALLIGITFFAYASSLTNPFIWDDEQFIQKNVYVQDFAIGKIFTSNTIEGAGIKSNYYRPLTSLGFAVDVQLWGTNTFGFHLTNLLLHIGAGIILFFLLESLSFGSFFSFCVSLLFLIHPIQTEAVSYINSRGDSQYTFFLFLSLFLFHKALKKTKSVHFYLASVIAFMVSILSKETAVAAFPVYFCLVFIASFRKKHKMVNYIWAGVIALMSIGYFGLRTTVLDFQNTLNFYGNADIYAQNLWIRLFTFAKVVWIYIGLLLFPYPLHMERSVDLVTTVFSPYVIATVLLIIAILYACIWEIRTKGKCILLFGFFISASLLIPVSGIIPINGILYEHWLYVPMVGFFIILLRGLQIAFEQFSFSKNIKLFIYPFALLCCIYVFLTIRQNNIWADPLSFYRYTVSFAPNSARLHNNLGMTLSDKGDYDGSIVEYKKALAIDPQIPQTYNNLGISYYDKKDYTNAETYFLKALSLAPNFQATQTNLLALYLTENTYKKALPLFKSLAPYTTDVRFFYNYGKALYIEGDREGAQEQFDKAVDLSHNNPDVILAIENFKTSQSK